MSSVRIGGVRDESASSDSAPPAWDGVEAQRLGVEGLPYGGDINAAMRAQDRAAVRFIMENRDRAIRTGSAMQT